jgi:hypothetical protein
MDKNQNKKLDEQTYLEYFDNMMKEKVNINNIIKEGKNKNKIKNLKQKRNRTFRDDKNTYLRKTREIQRLKYELDLKKMPWKISEKI